MLFASRTERFLCELLIFNGRSFVHEKGTPWFIRVKGNRISYVCACMCVRSEVRYLKRELSNGEHVTRDKKRFVNRLTQRGVVGT